MSFINSFFLFALGAAALPVLFHLVRRLQAKKVMFSSLMFLQATQKEVVRKRRLRDVLLMLLRCAVFALLALVFARPFLPQETLPFLPEREARSVVLLVDQSMSMQAGDRFERAKQEALTRLAEAEGSDEFSVVAFSDAAQQLTPLSEDVSLHQAVLSSLEPGYQPTDFYEPLRRATEILNDARNEQRTIVFISDFQQAGWTGTLDNWKLDPGIAFVPVTVADGAVANAYVEGFAVRTQRTGTDVAVQFDAQITAEGGRENEGNTALLSVDGAQVDQRTLGPRADHRLSAEQIAPREGFFQGELTLGDDALTADNRYFVTYAVTARPSMLAVDEGARGASDAFFLRTAFALGDNARYDFAEGGQGRLTRGILRGYNVVFLTAPGALTSSQVDALRNFMEAGGTLVVSAGDRPQVTALSGLLTSLGIGSATEVVNARAAQATDAIIGEVDLRHPIFEVFAGSGRGAILQPRFRRYLRVVPDSAATVLARYDTADPMLLERRVGSGKVLVYTSTFNTAWTDFALDESYVPFLYQLAKYAIESGATRHQYTVGEVVALRGQPEQVWDVRTPDGDVFQVQNDSTGAGFFREAAVPGHYVAVQGTRRFPFSVNVNPMESNLEARDAEEVYAAVVPPSDDVALTPEQATALAIEDEEKQQKLWRVILLLILALFLAETFLANRKLKPQRT